MENKLTKGQIKVLEYLHYWQVGINSKDSNICGTIEVPYIQTLDMEGYKREAKAISKLADMHLLAEIRPKHYTLTTEGHKAIEGIL